MYQITSTQNSSKSVHYHVRIREEADGTTGNIQVTGFRFLKAKTRLYPLILKVPASFTVRATWATFLFCACRSRFYFPHTNHFSHGTSLFYSQDPGSSPSTATTPYPAAGTAIDFAYPKVFYAVVKQGIESQFYNVIVDVRNPVQLSQAAVTISNVKAGSNQTVEATTFINLGNHPISIIGVDHSQQIPAGLNAIRGMATVPSFCLLPGKSSEVKALVSAQTYPPTTYQVRASFKPRLTDYWEADNFLQPAELHITTTIVN